MCFLVRLIFRQEFLMWMVNYGLNNDDSLFDICVILGLVEREIQAQMSQYIDMINNGAKYPHEEKYCKDGKILLPGCFGPIYGNCFFAVLFNETIPREDMADLYK
ncbi:putative cytochrome P450 [Pseudolycoriella hygida]|uniref:Cytochrome P450 n=1 Tax=Pseudolycoriella hygida TaxID=35572 RepID=A0A9Q0S5E9_9DIPT|nr:putative cytochrome P450 [Pseudolycoriella hygida]